jgi:hypothetical protein
MPMLTPALLLLATTAHTDAAPEALLSREALLRPLITKLKMSLRDPYSIRSLVLCSADNVRYENNRPVRWSVSFSLNAKNGFGAYAGITHYLATYDRGVVTGMVNFTPRPRSIFEVPLEGPLAPKTATCSPVPEATVQELLSQ